MHKHTDGHVENEINVDVSIAKAVSICITCAPQSCSHQYACTAGCIYMSSCKQETLPISKATNSLLNIHRMKADSAITKLTHTTSHGPNFVGTISKKKIEGYGPRLYRIHFTQ